MKKMLAVFAVLLAGLMSPAFADDGDCGGRQLHVQSLYNTPQVRDPDRVKLATLNVFYNGGANRYCGKVTFSDAYRGTSRRGSFVMIGCTSNLDSSGACPYQNITDGVSDGGPDTQSFGPLRMPGALKCIATNGYFGTDPNTLTRWSSGWICK